jgi:hypothetical protein
VTRRRHYGGPQAGERFIVVPPATPVAVEQAQRVIEAWLVRRAKQIAREAVARARLAAIVDAALAADDDAPRTRYMDLARNPLPEDVPPDVAKYAAAVQARTDLLNAGIPMWGLEHRRHPLPGPGEQQ